MAVEILRDTHHDTAALFCNGTDWAFGPVFQGDAEAKAEAFLHWFKEGHALMVAIELGLTRRGIGDGLDPRDYDPTDLERLYSRWREASLDADGKLRDEVAV